jgi:DNA-binding CsgD family transcriptional regulator
VGVVARAAVAIELSEEEEQQLRAVLRTPSASQQQALRARIVLRAAEGASNTQIAAEAGVSLPTVGLWRRNFAQRGVGNDALNWPRCDGLNWPHLRPMGGRPFVLHRARAGGARGNGIQGGTVRADQAGPRA